MAEKNSLWKNIRKKAEQNRRTGAKPKKPTAEMLRQERKIKANQKADGGYLYAEGGDGEDGKNKRSNDVLTQQTDRAIIKTGDYIDNAKSNIYDVLNTGADYLFNDVSFSPFIKAGTMNPKARQYYFYNYSPVEYPGYYEAIKPIVKSIGNTILEGDPSLTINRKIGYDKQGDYDVAEEAWRKTLGLPIKHKYITKSKYKPSISSEDSEYYTLSPDIIDKQRIIDYVKSEDFNKESKPGKLPNTRVANVKGSSSFIKDDFMPLDEYEQIDPLQNFQIHKAWDPEKKQWYAAIYDNYDFSFKPAQEILEPFEIYDRAYYLSDEKPIEYNAPNYQSPKEVNRIKQTQRDATNTNSRIVQAPQISRQVQPSLNQVIRSYGNPYMYYAGGPMYYARGGFLEGLEDAGKLLVNTVASPIEQISGNNFVNWNYNNKWAADAAAVSEGIIGAATDVAGSILLPGVYGQAKGAIQGFTKNLGHSTEYQRGANKWANTTGQIASSAGDLTAGIMSGDVKQIVGGSGKLLGTIGSETGSKELSMLGQAAGIGSMFINPSQAAGSSMPTGLPMDSGIPSFNPTTDIVNQGLSFAANGGPINNNLLTLQTGSMRENIKNHRKKYSKGGTFHKYGINPIPDSAGYHHKNAYGGVTIGRDAMAEGGEFVIDGNYVISDEVDGMNTLTKDGKTMAEIFDRYLSPYKLRDLNSKNKDGLRRPNDSISQHSIEQKKEQIIAEHKELKAKEEGKAQQKEMMVNGALQYAAAGGKLNKDLENILSNDIQKYVEADNYYAYGGYLPKDKGFNMPNSYAKGGSIHIKKSKRGTFTAAAKKHGKSVQEFARQVLANKGNYSSAMVKKANFARNAAKWHHAEGGNIRPDNPGFNALPEYVQAKIMNNMAHGGPVVSNVNQDFDLYAQNRGGMMMAQGGNMYANGGPPDGDPNSLDYITGVSDFMYSPEFLNYWTNTQDKRNVNYESIYDRGNLPLSEERFSPTEGISDFDRTLGNLYSAEKAIFLNTNPDGSVCYIIDGQKVCGPPGQIQAMLANRDRTYQAQAVADVYQNTTGDFAPYNYNNITGSTAARPVNQPDYSGDQNFTDRQNKIRGMVSNAMTRNQSTPVQPIERMQSRNLQQLPTDNTPLSINTTNYPESSYRPATLTEEEQNMLDRMSNTVGFIPSDVMSGKLGTSTAPFPYEEGPVDNSIPKVGPSIEQNIRFVPPGGSDIIEDLPGTVPTQTKVSDEAIGQSYLGTAANPNLPKLTFTQSDATKYGLNPNDVNITDDTKVNQPNQGLTGLDYGMMVMGSLGAFDKLRRGAKGPDPVNFERIGFEPYNYYPDIVLADAALREGEDKAAYDLKQYAPSSGSYMANRRALGLGAGKNRADQRQRIKSAATQFDLARKTGIDAQNAQIQMQESIARQQELDAARENVTEGLDMLGNRANMVYRDYKINKVNETIANNIGTTNWKVVDDGKGGSVVVFRGNDGSYKAIPYQQATTPNTNSTTASTGYMTPVNPNTTTPVATAAKSFKFDDNITDKTKGDAFRAWVNKNYPRYAKNADLSLSGVYNNDYIRDAWDVYGEKYLGQS